jgi:hypothetical protein
LIGIVGALNLAPGSKWIVIGFPGVPLPIRFSMFDIVPTKWIVSPAVICPGPLPQLTAPLPVQALTHAMAWQSLESAPDWEPLPFWLTHQSAPLLWLAASKTMAATPTGKDRQTRPCMNLKSLLIKFFKLTDKRILSNAKIKNTAQLRAASVPVGREKDRARMAAGRFGRLPTLSRMNLQMHARGMETRFVHAVPLVSHSRENRCPVSRHGSLGAACSFIR